MSWANNLQDASFRGVKFDVARTRDGRQKATASHEYPYLDGADVEDLGGRARHFSMTAVFWATTMRLHFRGSSKCLTNSGPAS